MSTFKTRYLLSLFSLTSCKRTLGLFPTQQLRSYSNLLYCMKFMSGVRFENALTSVGFCRESRVEGNVSRVEGKMSRVQKCWRFFIIIYCLYFLLLFFKFFFVSKNIDFVYIQALSLLSKTPEFLGRFSITCIEQFTSVLYTIEYFHTVSSIQKTSRFHFLVV